VSPSPNLASKQKEKKGPLTKIILSSVMLETLTHNVRSRAVVVVVVVIVALSLGGGGLQSLSLVYALHGGNQIYLDNFTGPHYGMPCKDSPSTMCYYPAPSTQQQQQQQSQRNGTTIFGPGIISPFAKTHNNITTTTNPLGCLDDPAVACGP
jgi:hypothetical protein